MNEGNIRIETAVCDPHVAFLEANPDAWGRILCEALAQPK